MKHLIGKITSFDNWRGVYTNRTFNFKVENLNCVSNVIYFHSLFGQPCRLPKYSELSFVLYQRGEISGVC